MAGSYDAIEYADPDAYWDKRSTDGNFHANDGQNLPVSGNILCRNKTKSVTNVCKWEAEMLELYLFYHVTYLLSRDVSETRRFTKVLARWCTTHYVHFLFVYSFSYPVDFVKLQLIFL